jgi:aminoglycoside phosphotransferase (APT) family kinase protein
LVRIPDGGTATIGRIADPRQAATELGQFVAALQRIDPAGGPPPGVHNFARACRWLHGDLQVGNLLAQRGRLSAVIDFGCLGVGDPACDVMAAWTYLSAETRDVFRAALPVDDATWARGRGWALSFGVIALPYYQTTNPVLAGIARNAIDEALADHERTA